MKIIQEKELKEGKDFYLLYIWADTPDAGFSFDCDEHGNVFPFKNPEAQENYNKCVSGEYEVTFEGVQFREWSYTDPANGECSCGNYVRLNNFTNTCNQCGNDYNFAGQLLALREQWGEETGEHWSDCY
jgi:hypothetical protein